MNVRTPITISIAHVPVRIYWGWAVVLVLVVLVLRWLYGGLFAPGLAWAGATASATALWGGVLAHEFGHALMALRCGVAVRGIALLAFGGVTEVAEDIHKPQVELFTALAGPLVSFALACAAGLGWWFSGEGLLQLVLLHAALVNGAMAAFNLLPAYPLDGGRVLRAVLWFLSEDEIAAGRWVLACGRWCGRLFVLLGFLYAGITMDLGSAVWLIVGGFFLSHSAQRGYNALVVRRVLRGVRVEDVMQRSYATVTPDVRLDQFVGRFVMGQQEDTIPVIYRGEEGQPALLGMMSHRNVRSFSFNQWPFTRVGEAMTPSERTRQLSPDTSADDAFRALIETGADQLPVTRHGLLLGMLRRRDILTHVQLALVQHRPRRPGRRW